MVILILVVLGLCFGSFINAFIWRFHEASVLRDERATLQAKKKPSAKDQKRLQAIDGELAALSILKGRSRCPHCGHELGARDLVPVVSYFALGRKCRYCRASIADTPVAELVTPLAFVLSYIFWPHGFEAQGLVIFIFWLAIMVGLVALALYDLKWHELPHEIVFWLVVLTLLQTGIVSVLLDGGARYALQAAYGALIISGLFVLLYRISPKVQPDDGEETSAGWQGIGSRVFGYMFGWATGRRESQWIGGGDITLGLLLGLLAGGPVQAFLLIFLASVLGTLVMLPSLVMGKSGWHTKLPFGPFLIAAAVIVVLFGARIIDWYTTQFLTI